MVELNPTSNNDFPSSRVVKKVKGNERKEGEMKEKKERAPGKKEKKNMDCQKKGKR